MNALILGGQSPRHYKWVRNLAEVMQPHFDEVVFLDYRHWQDENQDTDIDYEIEQAAKLAGRLGNYVVVAKSLGTVITALAIARGKLAPKSCTLMGLPLALMESLPEVGSAFKALPPTTFLQNNNDPLGSAKAVQAYIKRCETKDYKFKSLLGNTHDYPDFDLIDELAASRTRS